VSNIREVAKRAGVSTATVSRVLSRPDVVSPETRVRVLKAIERLGYAPNSVAKNLRTLKSRKLLVTVPDISNPFFSLILQGIEDAAQKNGYAVLLGDTQHDEQREERYAQMLKQKEADGLIFLGHRLPKVAACVVQEMAPHCAPIVNGCEFSAELGVPSVHIDNATAAAEAMEHLYGLGHRVVGVVTGPLLSPLSRDRLKGALAAARARGLEADVLVSQGDFSIKSGAEAAACLFARATRPTAVFCFNDEMAMGVIVHARDRGLHVPTDLSVVGFDDTPIASRIWPSLTTIRLPIRDMGRIAAEKLIAKVHEHDKPASIESTVFPHLVLRGSSAKPGPG
jgi:LacI family repressor for deo operon, udp, cdd, tsx, nupC, and nupG